MEQIWDEGGDVDRDVDRDETSGGRLDRQWTELLQELRVTQTGIQLIAGFLLTLPFQNRFVQLTPGLHGLYLAAVGFATLSLAFVIAPIVAHRILFRSHRKDVLVDLGHLSARVGILLLAITVVCVTGLTFGFAVGEAAALVAGSGTALVCLTLWWAVPTLLGHTNPGGISYTVKRSAR